MIGLGLGLTLSAARAQIFDLAHLFTSGSGFLYPLSDGTLWQDAAGTTPVTADGQVVGFAQDGSKGLALGPELVTNGTFDTDVSGWTADTGATLSWTASGIRVQSSAFNVGALQTVSTVSGRMYRVSGRVVSGPFPRLFFGSTAVGLLAGANFTVHFFATGATTVLELCASESGSDIVWDNISVREVLGNHATQPGTASIRPTYKTGPTRLSFDGSDDRLVSTLMPTASGTIACRFQTSTAGRVMIGSQGATDGRCYLGIGSDGRLAAGIGAAGMTTITGGTDIRGTGWHSGAVTWDQTTVKLYLDGAEVYSGAQSGAVNTTIPMAIGALNANGTQNSFFLGDILANPIALDYAATPAQIAQMHQAWSNQT